MGRILLAECGILESGFSFLLFTFLAFLRWIVLTEVPSINESNVVSILLKIVTKREANDFFFFFFMKNECFARMKPRPLHAPTRQLL